MGACRPQTPAPNKEKNSPPALPAALFQVGYISAFWLALTCAIRRRRTMPNVLTKNLTPHCGNRPFDERSGVSFFCRAFTCRSSAEPCRFLSAFN